MCETCGCGKPGEFVIYDPNHTHNHDSDYTHEHDHGHTHDHPHEHNHSHKKIIDLDIDILSQNNMTAGLNRRFFEGRKVLCFNLVSSPGSGKTTVLEKTISQLISSRKIYVIEGDQQTLIDANRIEKAGAPAIQINTGSGCHLDAKMIDAALKKMDIEAGSVLFIENVGNLVCPAMFDLGEHKRVLIASVTEGEDKPLKYPKIFETSHLCIINKSDLLPYVDFRTEEFMKNARLINHQMEFITVSAKTGEGLNLWFNWILSQI
ncbi:MAG TPA: hydrogenase accessory protein HypB [Bacteroidales bacterium]|nr:hydrogenase accessory protein HypB [Bacteroidales bacterium]HBZ22238.1 hydrogenase accessory protein HypB [Bacteroidales bacterium]